MIKPKQWKFWLGAAWILGTALYFHIHFVWVFIQANRNAIAALWR